VIARAMSKFKLDVVLSRFDSSRACNVLRKSFIREIKVDSET
jgi:hypothetical protein